jgi:uncharacterized protein YegJ (DUF2314 family)
MADEPIFMAIRNSDPAFQQTVRDAHASLPEFRRLLKLRKAADWYPSIKTRVTAGEDSAFLWLSVDQVLATGFVASVFEIPKQFEGIEVGDEIQVADSDVMDWMINRNGELHGGFSLRYQRAKLPPEDRDDFDQHIGVSRYAEQR